VIGKFAMFGPGVFGGPRARLVLSGWTVPPRCAALPKYRPRRPGDSALYQVIETHLETFLAHTAGDAESSGVPVFVKREFEAYLRCGILAHGFARVRCEGCAFERLVPFSCKGRGFCPSCGGRRMTEHAGQLVETVLPRVPVRQWVLTLPYRLRYRLAWDHGLTRAVLSVYARVLQDFYVRSAHGLGIGRGRTGMLTVVQRFGSGVNLNVHFHTLALDGVFTERTPGRLQFHAATPPSDEAVGAVLSAIRYRVGRLLARRGLEPGTEPAAPDGLAESSPILAQIMSASVHGRVALGRHAGTRAWAASRLSASAGATGRARLIWTGSISMPTSGFALIIGPGWSISVGTCCAPRSRKTGCTSGPTGGWRSG
jgi:hypothetical protein